ncbi:MAG: hypothetical protein J7L40_00065 [Candidatus Marinimicrobia bacterium]|nr:hypothetical protein [Candidatus Neomarinimicrobiota bacterium]
MKAIWFVVHQERLWNIDKNFIGFWNKAQMDRVSEADYIIYYRTGIKQIMGVFKAGEKGEDLNKDFYNDESIIKRLVYQCRIVLVNDDIICSRPTTECRFSFYDEWQRNRYGGFKKQIFLASYDDIKLILRDPLLIK